MSEILDVRNFDCISGHSISIGHFGCPKFNFDYISGHFRSIGHFGCVKFTFDLNSGHWMGRQCQLSNSSDVFG